MIRFVDLEASSLLPGCFPIEIAWVDADGCGQSFLIRPPDRWLRADRGMLGWSRESEAIHGITVERLMAEGEPVAEVARRAAEALSGTEVTAYSDTVGSDERWLDMLLEEGGRSERVTLHDVRNAYSGACERLRVLVPPSPDPERPVVQIALSRIAEPLIGAALEGEKGRQRVRHRALPDAQGLWWTWTRIAENVERYLAGAGRA